MFFNSKPKMTFTLQWHFDDEMLDRIKIVEEYDKLFSLKHFMIKIGFSNLEVSNYMKYKNPFLAVSRDVNNIDTYNCDYRNMHETNLKRSLNFMELLLIENPDDNYLNVIISQLISTMAEYICSFIFFERGKINAPESYRYMLQTICDEDGFFPSELYMCLNILIKRYGSVDKFVEEYEKNRDIGCYNSFYKGLQKCIGSDYLDGILFKSVEYSLVNWKKHSSNKLFFKKDIDEFNEYELYGITFKENKDCNKLFCNNFDKFKEDINQAQVMINTAYNLYEDYQFTTEISKEILYDTNNYSVLLQLLTSGGHKKKYPLRLVFSYVLENIAYEFIYSYNLKGILDRIDITLLNDYDQRIIICKKEKGELYIAEIKARNIANGEFPKVWYKK